MRLYVYAYFVRWYVYTFIRLYVYTFIWVNCIVEIAVTVRREPSFYYSLNARCSSFALLFSLLLLIVRLYYFSVEVDVLIVCGVVCFRLLLARVAYCLLSSFDFLLSL